MNFHKLIFTICLTTVVATAGAIDVTFSGNSLKVLSISPEASTGLENIFVAYNLSGVSASIRTESEAKWYKFSNLGGGFAEELPGAIYSGGISTIDSLEGNSGYIVEYEGRQHPFWLVEYGPSRLNINSIEPSDNQDCGSTQLNISGSGGDPIHYFTVVGQQKTLSREIEVTYTSLEWSDTTKEFVQIPCRATLASLPAELSVTPPALCPTTFRITGDRFLSEWNWETSAESSPFHPVAVDARSFAEQESTASSDEKSNLIKSPEGEGLLGGSAPVTINFTSSVTDAVVHNEWQMSRDGSFADPEFRFTDRDFSYTFTEDGIFYVRFLASNPDGSCTQVCDPFTISLGASDLKIPNVFSPNDDGVNDVWKVAYRSILSFECWIFDRYGNQLAHLTSPQQGWDGKRGGKVVAPGVYYYVIQAKGADGKTYKKSGDINILRSEAVPKI